ncbi:MAG: hypothetical protein ACT4P1_01165 [Sporichthyaceae bacterium]
MRGALALGIALTLYQILVPSLAVAHGGGDAVLDLSGLDRVARTVLIATAVLLAGAALLRPIAGGPTEIARRLLVSAAALAAAAATAGAFGELPRLQYLALGALTVAALLAVLIGRAVPSLLAGAAIVGWLCRDALSDGAASGALMVGHVAAAAVWSAAILAGATVGRGQRTATVRRLTPAAIAAGVLATATGVWSARDYDVTLSGITVTDFGTLVLVKAALVAAVVALGAIAAVRARRGAGRLPARMELVVVSVVVLAGSALTALPPPGPPAARGVPLVRAMDFDDVATGVVVVPQRPGPNLVHLMTDRFTDVLIDGRRYRAAPRPGAQGMWAEVELPTGRSRLEIRQGTRVNQQVLDAGSAAGWISASGPDLAECSSAALGAALGGSVAPLGRCPHEALAAVDAGALRALVTTLGTRGARALGLLSDDTPRGRAAAALVRAAAEHVGITIKDGMDPGSDVVLALAGWEVAHEQLTVRRQISAPLYGTYLAPWLMQSQIVAAAGASPVAALPFNPAGETATSYLGALRRVGPDQSASAAGFAAYLAARAAPVPDPGVLLYAATDGFQVAPGAAGDPGQRSHHGSGVGWLAGGALTAVSSRLDPAPARR